MADVKCGSENCKETKVKSVTCKKCSTVHTSFKCPTCNELYNKLWMEDAQNIALNSVEQIKVDLKKFDIELNLEEEDKLYVDIEKKIEELSNGYYRSQN